jgi:hypothetical protein
LHLDNSINWTPLYAAPVISAVSQPRRQGNEKIHMSIFKLIVGVIFNVAFFGVLLFCQQVLWIGGEEKRVRPLKENRIAAPGQSHLLDIKNNQLEHIMEWVANKLRGILLSVA